MKEKLKRNIPQYDDTTLVYSWAPTLRAGARKALSEECDSCCWKQVAPAILNQQFPSKINGLEILWGTPQILIRDYKDLSRGLARFDFWGKNLRRLFQDGGPCWMTELELAEIG
jgi:hypothetical protein